MSTFRRHAALRPIQRGLVAAAAAAALSAAFAITVTTPAAATAGNCTGGFVNANKAWGQCRTASGGWGGFKLTVNCYYYPQQSSYGQAPQTVWATCPAWSHVTGIYVVPAAY